MGKDVDRMALERKYGKNIRFEEYREASMAMNKAEKQELAAKSKTREKKDRATTEQVMDPKTRLMVLKMINNNLFDKLYGCISTGKEANVYMAVSEQAEEMPEKAVKIYKTSILVFKDRDRYVTGEFRFRSGYSRHNPRKMVKLWAEKEFRNLHRLHREGIRCPKPIAIKNHVLVMEFIGKDGIAAPRLKDVHIQQIDRWLALYVEMILIMRTMYKRCHLVHADLSEYNILYYNKHLYIIDVSQSVEHEHPHALQFLRMDCFNVTRFFGKMGVSVLRTRELFDFVSDLTLQSDREEAVLAGLQARCEERGPMTDDEMLEESIWMQSYIPHHLHEVIDAAGDIEKVKEGDTKDILYHHLVGFNTIDHKGEDDIEGDEEVGIDHEEPIDDDDGEPIDDDGEEVDVSMLTEKEKKKLAKKEFKLMQREKRKVKVPKKVKRRKKKMAQQYKK